MAIAVVAFGGNAFLPQGASGTYDEQLEKVRSMAQVTADLHRRGYLVVVTHGNGPQVGALAIQQERAAGDVPPQPLFVLDAMTQGQLGHLVTVGIRSALADSVEVCAVVTHVVVAGDDDELRRPTKPIGPFFDRDEASRLGDERGWTMHEVSEGAYRRVVASPAPQRIVEVAAVRTLVESGAVVVAGGGGGVPLTESNGGELHGVDAVVDKDRVARLLGEAVDAELLVLVTGVPSVRLGYGSDDERPVDEMSVASARKLLADGQFPPGSMGPKVESAAQFVADGGQLAVITSAEHVDAALDGAHGTRIVSGSRTHESTP